MEEIWKDIVGFEGSHLVSNLGRVKRLSRPIKMRNQVTEWFYQIPELIYSLCNDSKGYPQVALTFEGRKRTARVHRLVAESFLPPPSDELVETCKKAGLDYVQVNHKDCNRENNRWDNLEWCSPKFNCDWAVSSGKHNSQAVRGESNYMAELTEKDVDEILMLLRSKSMSQEKIGELYGVKQITISNIWTGRSWAWYTGIPWKARTRKKNTSESMAES